VEDKLKYFQGNVRNCSRDERLNAKIIFIQIKNKKSHVGFRFTVRVFPA